MDQTVIAMNGSLVHDAWSVTSLLATIDLPILAAVSGGCIAAWVLAAMLSRLIQPGWAAPSVTSALGAARWREAIVLLIIAALVGLLFASMAAMVSAGETLVMSIAGVLAVVASPLVVLLLEADQLPRAEKATMGRHSRPAARSVILRRAA